MKHKHRNSTDYDILVRIRRHNRCYLYVRSDVSIVSWLKNLHMPASVFGYFAKREIHESVHSERNAPPGGGL